MKEREFCYVKEHDRGRRESSSLYEWQQIQRDILEIMDTYTKNRSSVFGYTKRYIHNTLME